MKKKVYLAIPFSGMEEESFKAANEVAAELISQGYLVFSPISHSYPIWNTNRVKHDYETWLEQDKSFVEWADFLMVILPVRNNNVAEASKRIFNSKGVQHEIKWFKEVEKEIKYIEHHI